MNGYCAVQLTCYLKLNSYSAVQRSIRIQIQCPGFGEQAAIARILSDMDSEITALEKRREKKSIKQAMIQELLTGKTRLV